MELIATELTHWHWLTIAVVLFALEIFAPSSFLLWPAIAAVITGICSWLLPDMSWQLQLALFALLAVFVTLTGRYFYKNKVQSETSHPTLNRRADSHKGRVITIEEPIINGVGSVMIGDTRWRLVGKDLPAGSVLTVTGTEGSSLKVEEAVEKAVEPTDSVKSDGD